MIRNSQPRNTRIQGLTRTRRFALATTLAATASLFLVPAAHAAPSAQNSCVVAGDTAELSATLQDLIWG